ncbi:hypothetical protein Hdeb2414_s0012g00397221 [Helianthus debilis subsp. tardiflorus]
MKFWISYLDRLCSATVVSSHVPCRMQSSARYKADKYSPKYELQAKLADFGLSKIIDTGLSHVSSEVRGTFGCGS